MNLKFGLKQYIPLAISALAFASTAFGATAFINQVGYRASDAKEFTLLNGNGPVEIVDAAGQTVLTATPSVPTNWDGSGQNVSLVDFSDLKTPGTYSIKIGGQIVRSDLKVTEKTFEDVTKAAIKWFYYQRASMELEQTYADKWKRAAGHTKSTIEKHSSAGNGSIQSTKGWYDAGDYGRYIVNSGITTYTLLSLFEHYPEYFKTLKWNIPADGTLPDLLAEIKWNLDWMLTMQDTDGGVFHKMTSLGFPGDIMPAKDTDPIYVIGKGTAATFDFAGVMAIASRVYKDYDANFAAQCLEAAKKAYAWGAQNPNTRFKNPNDVSTGEYGDGNLGDEKLFAGSELFLATNDASYKPSISEAGVPNWGDVSGLAVYGSATYGADAHSKQLLLSKADALAARTQTGFGVAMAAEDYVWGSNAVAANQGIWLLHAYYLTGDNKYYVGAVKVLDYLLGKNPLDMSFMTGFGSKSPKKPHHRPSTADGVSAPVPGMLVGGPQNNDNSDVNFNNNPDENWKCSDYTNPNPALSYVDNNCSYATNEVAINWNAPLSYLAGAIEALNAGYAPSFAVAGVAKGGSDAIKPSMVQRAPSSESQVRLRFADQKVFLEKNGKRYDLKGMQIK